MAGIPIQDAIGTLVSKIAKLENEIARMEKQNGTLSIDNEALKGRIKSLEFQLKQEVRYDL